MKYAVMFWSISLVVATAGQGNIKDKTMDKPELKHYFLPTSDQYLDWYKVTDDNLPQRIHESVDPWIVALCPENQLPVVWKNFVRQYRGVIFFGRFWAKDGTDLENRFGYVGKPMLLVYPWSRDGKKTKPETTDDLGKALETVIASMPVKKLNQITFATAEDEPTNMNQFLLRSFYGTETKPQFPILFVYDDMATGGVPPIFRTISHYFSDYFNFGLINSKNIDEMRNQFTSYPKPKESELPQAVAIIGTEPGDDSFDEGDASLSFKLVVMSKLKFGDFTFDNLVAFLFWINDNFRTVLPGRTDDESLDDQTIKTIRNKLWWRVETIKPATVKKVKKQSNLEKKTAEALSKFDELKKQAKKLAENNKENVEKIKETIENASLNHGKDEL